MREIEGSIWVKSGSKQAGRVRDGQNIAFRLASEPFNEFVYYVEEAKIGRKKSGLKTMYKIKAPSGASRAQQELGAIRPPQKETTTPSGASVKNLVGRAADLTRVQGYTPPSGALPSQEAVNSLGSEPISALRPVGANIAHEVGKIEANELMQPILHNYRGKCLVSSPTRTPFRPTVTRAAFSVFIPAL